jgi:hypothetical protein
MFDAERLAAALAIRLIDDDRRHPRGYQVLPSHRRLENLTQSETELKQLSNSPYLRYVIDEIVAHYRELSDSDPLPGEDEVVQWIRDSGGIAALLLQFLALPASRDVRWSYTIRSPRR